MTVGFLGDSITLGYALEDKSKRYATVLSEALGVTEVNHGITGTLVAKAGLNATDGLDYVSRLHLILDCDVAVIFGGTNDYFWSDKPISGDDDSYFAHAMETIAKRVCELRAGKVTLIVTPYPHNGIGNFLGGEMWRTSSRHDTSAKNFSGHTLSDYVETTVRVCEKYGLPCLNLHRDFAFDWRVHTSDGCHPNEDGHKLLAEAIGAKLKELI